MTDTRYFPHDRSRLDAQRDVHLGGQRESARPRVDPQSAVIRWAFLLLVFSIPLESANLGITGPYLSLTKLLGFMFMGVSLMKPHVTLGRRPITFWYFAAYAAAVVMSGLIARGPDAVIFSRLFSLVQLLVFFLISYNLLSSRSLARQALTAFALACVVVAVLQLTGISRVSLDYGNYERQAALGINANATAAILSMGLLALVGLSFGSNGPAKLHPSLSIPACALLAVAIIQTGSRGGMAALAAGVLAIAFQSGGGVRKVRATIIAAAILSVGVGLVLRSDISRERWNETLNEGRFARRERITPMAWQMVQERPMFGWGPEEHTLELGARMGERSLDPHSLYLWLLTESGVLGAVPFLMALFLCVRSAWRARKGPGGIVPLILIVNVLVVNVPGTYHLTKWFWLVVAYCLASSSTWLSAPRDPQRGLGASGAALTPRQPEISFR